MAPVLSTRRRSPRWDRRGRGSKSGGFSRGREQGAPSVLRGDKNPKAVSPTLVGKESGSGPRKALKPGSRVGAKALAYQHALPGDVVDLDDPGRATPRKPAQERAATPSRAGRVESHRGHAHRRPGGSAGRRGCPGRKTDRSPSLSRHQHWFVHRSPSSRRPVATGEAQLGVDLEERFDPVAGLAPGGSRNRSALYRNRQSAPSGPKAGCWAGRPPRRPDPGWRAGPGRPLRVEVGHVQGGGIPGRDGDGSGEPGQAGPLGVGSPARRGNPAPRRQDIDRAPLSRSMATTAVLRFGASGSCRSARWLTHARSCRVDDPIREASQTVEGRLGVRARWETAVGTGPVALSPHAADRPHWSTKFTEKLRWSSAGEAARGATLPPFNLPGCAHVRRPGACVDHRNHRSVIVDQDAAINIFGGASLEPEEEGAVRSEARGIAETPGRSGRPASGNRRRPRLHTGARRGRHRVFSGAPPPAASEITPAEGGCTTKLEPARPVGC